MVATHSIKIGGKWYKAGEKIPALTYEPKKLEENKDDELTKTDIRRMSTAELKELATKEGIDGAEDMTGAELKELLIAHFKL